jgi:hypothetical protein
MDKLTTLLEDARLYLRQSDLLSFKQIRDVAAAAVHVETALHAAYRLESVLADCQAPSRRKVNVNRSTSVLP